jgi:hypothetical protein
MAYERDIKITKGINDIYKFYKDKFKEDAIDEKIFKSIFYTLNKEISNLIITRSFEYRLPYRMGYLRIKKRKLNLKIKDGKIETSRNLVDWVATWEYWHSIYPDKIHKEIKKIKGKKRIYQLNNHTNGDIMGWYWDKKISNVKNQSVYKFRSVKGGVFDDKYIGRLGLAKWIKSDEINNEYFY